MPVNTSVSDSAQEVLASTVRKEIEMNAMTEEEEMKIVKSVDMAMYIAIPRESTNHLLGIIRQFNRYLEKSINTSKPILFSQRICF